MLDSNVSTQKHMEISLLAVTYSIWNILDRSSSICKGSCLCGKVQT